MSDPTTPILPPDICAYPTCSVVLPTDQHGTCDDPTHRNWLDHAIAACNAGDHAALELWQELDPTGLNPELATTRLQGELFPA